MTGPEHYAEAARILEVNASGPDGGANHRRAAEAQVHATLALVAVMVDSAPNLLDCETWYRVTGG